MKHYEYNYDFLAEWLDDHPKMLNKAAKAIGTSAASLSRWVVDIGDPYHRKNHLDKNGNRVSPINIERMINFCNQFDVDISSFFLDGGKKTSITPKGTDGGTYLPENPQDRQAASETLLQVRLDHANELREIQRQAHEREETLRREYQQREDLLRKDSQQREDQMRKDYEQRIDEYKEMVREGMETTKLALSNDSHKTEDCDSEYGVADYLSQMPHPNVNPKKR